MQLLWQAIGEGACQISPTPASTLASSFRNLTSRRALLERKQQSLTFENQPETTRSWCFQKLSWCSRLGCVLVLLDIKNLTEQGHSATMKLYYKTRPLDNFFLSKGKKQGHWTNNKISSSFLSRLIWLYWTYYFIIGIYCGGIYFIYCFFTSYDFGLLLSSVELRLSKILSHGIVPTSWRHPIQNPCLLGSSSKLPN